MLEKQKRLKSSTNNINININLKLQSKANQLTGKKISQCKQINHKHGELVRSTITTQSLAKKPKNPHYRKNKRSIQEFIDQNTINYEEPDEDSSHQKSNLQRNQQVNQFSKRKSQRRMNSKSLESLRIKCQQKSPERGNKSHSKSKSKSKSKKKNNGNVSPPSNIKSHKSKSNNKSKSKSKSKSRSKSPLHLNKKKSLQVFKIKQDLSTRDRQKEREKSRDKKIKQVKQKMLKQKKIQPIDVSKNGVKTAPNVSKKVSENQTIIKSKIKKSVQKIVKSSGLKIKNKQKDSINKSGSKMKRSTSKQQRIYHESFLNRMAIKIQRLWRGYKVRKQWRAELKQVMNKVCSIKEALQIKNSKLWENDSNHSIIQIDSQSNLSSKSNIFKNSKKNLQLEENNDIKIQFMEELAKLKKKLEEQEDRVKVLAEQNNELRTNLNKIGTKQKRLQEKIENKNSRQLVVNPRVISVRIESQESQKDDYEEKNIIKKQKIKILELPAAIKTQELNSDYTYSQMKKKVQIYECSPKNEIFKNKFNKVVIRKLFLQKQQNLNQKYFKKNIEIKDLLQNQMISPKTYNCKWQQLQKKLKRQKQQTLNKYKEAEKALMLVAQIQEDQDNTEQKQNNNFNSMKLMDRPHLIMSNSSNNDSKHQSPIRKALNLYINVDQIDTNSQKYYPIISNHSHRSPQKDISQQDQDLSELYNKAMHDKIESNKRDVYVNQDEDSHQIDNKLESQDQHSRELNNNVELNDKKNQSICNAKKGFKNNLQYIRIFYIKFCQFFRQIPLFKEQILYNISQQITFDIKDFLKFFRRSQEQQNQNDRVIFPYFKLLATYNAVINVQTLNAFYEQLANPESQLYQKDFNQLKQASKEQFISNGYSIYQLKQYHDLALLDAFNEALNYERPGGNQGSNIDILTQNYHTIWRDRISSKFVPSIEEKYQEQYFDAILGNSIGRVINNWACSLCGFINDECSDEQKIDDSKLQQIRQYRLSIILEKILIEEEDSMLNMSLFYLNSKMEVSIKIINVLIQQFVRQLNRMRVKRQLKL